MGLALSTFSANRRAEQGLETNVYLISESVRSVDMARKRQVVIGFLGTVLDAGRGPKRWEKWRPSVAVCQHEEFIVDRLVLLHPPNQVNLVKDVTADIRRVSPETEVDARPMRLANPWDLEEVYGALHDFARAYPFKPEREEYLIHIATGTHIAQICMFLLVEARYLPGRLIQTSPPQRRGHGGAGSYAIIDLDLSRYDRLASRFGKEQREGLSLLKSGIDTRNQAFNALIERIERVAMSTRDPLLLTGPTGAGKSRLARKIFELKRARRKLGGDFVEVNCATLRGDGAMSALFGHARGAFTGATADRPGLLRRADKGLLFLDEIGEMGLDEQAMLLRALEEKVFYPMGADKEVASEFQLLAGTNRDLAAQVAAGRFREDLLARINLWTFRLPELRERPEDLEPNLDYELQQSAKAVGVNVTFSAEARAAFLGFATGPEGRWPGNFRDFAAAVRRMATLAEGGRITHELVREELHRLREAWGHGAAGSADPVGRLLGEKKAGALDRFDRAQLAEVVRVCRQAKSLSEAGRQLFAVSRTQRSTINDADRLKKYLARFELEWKELQVQEVKESR
jgi:transcriptional regulatory protein RtcR